jgi:hypothetical protein
MSDAVSNTMRMLSLEPLTDGVPAHCATDGILPLFYYSPMGFAGQGPAIRCVVACVVCWGMECCIGREHAGFGVSYSFAIEKS